MEVTGKIKLIKATETKGSKGFRVREMVLTTNEQYPQHLLIQFTQDRCDILDNYQIGQDVKIFINLKGREWTNPKGEVVYFNSIDGWKIEQAGQVQAQQAPQQPMQPQATMPAPPNTSGIPAGPEPDRADTFEDDLPF